MHKQKNLLQNILFILAIMAAICFLFLWYTSANQKRIREQNLNYSLDSARQNARHVEDEFDAALKQIRTTSLSLSSSLIQPNIDAAILRRMELNSIFGVLRFTDASGITITSDGSVTDSSDRDFYRQGMQGESGISVLFGSRINGETMLNFYMPVYYNGEIIGVLRGVYYAKQYLQDMLTASYFGESADVFLCAADGTVISSSSDTLDYEGLLPDILLDNDMIDLKTAENMWTSFHTNRGEWSFVCDKDSSVDSLCMIALSNSDYILVQTFPRNVTQVMVSNANHTGIILQAALLGLFYICILFLTIRSGHNRKILEQENRELDYIRKGVNCMFSHYVLVDLETNTYQYLSGTRPKRIDFPSAGSYEELPAYIASFLVDEEERSQVMAQLEPEIIISNLGESNTVLRYEYLVHYNEPHEWFNANIICLERRKSRASKVLLLWQDITDFKESMLHTQETASQTARREQRYLTAMLTDAFCTYEINLTKGIIERVSVSSRNDLIRTQLGDEWVDQLEETGTLIPCPLSIWHEMWKGFIMEDSLKAYNTVADNQRLLELFAQGETGASSEYWTQCKGITLCIRESCYMMQDSDSSDVMGLVIVQEVTNQVNQQKEQILALKDALKQAQRANVAKNTFLSNMSHDIRTPMNAIIGFTNIALRHINNKEQVEHCLQKVISSSSHLLRLINDILDMTHIESGQMQLKEQPCSLPATIRDMFGIIQPLARTKHLELSANAFRILNESVIADSLKLCQIFVNLMGNAVKYTPSHGKITFEISQRSSFDETFGNYIFTVKDTGIGMSPEFMEHLFEPFERESTVTKTGIHGVGLGLTITKHIVDLMGGTIEVESKKDDGTEFRVNLNLKLQKENKDVEKDKGLELTRIMVIDDDPDSSECICGLLRLLGVHPIHATSSNDAPISENSNSSIDCYIINWQTGKLDPVKTAKNIRTVVGSEIPIIVVTAYDWMDIETEAKHAGVTAFCAKPLFQSNMKSTLLNIGKTRKSTEKPDSALPDFKRKRVLLVDDIELNLEIAQEILKEAGFHVETASDGSDALEIMRHAEENYYDVILMDIQMPIMNGFEATAAIRALPRKDVHNLPIIAITANTSDEDRAAALASGMNYLLAKPLDISNFISVLDKFLNDPDRLFEFHSQN